MGLKLIKTMLFFQFFFCSLSIFAGQNTYIKFYMNDGSFKEYNITEIVNIGIINSNSNYVMKIFYKDSLIIYYPTEIINKIQLELDMKYSFLDVYICGYPKTYYLNSIDSIIFLCDIYQPLTIGKQVWMLKNLNMGNFRNGDSIPHVIDSALWVSINSDSIGGWCYYKNNPDSGKIYGKLYNWYVVNDPRGLAPAGWHVAGDSEWAVLSDFIGGDDIASAKLKESGTLHWLSPNEGVTNEWGFTALPAGSRSPEGTFSFIGFIGDWWTTGKWVRGIGYDNTKLGLQSRTNL